jgi:DNA-binding beta-propeller fold protein YncE
MKNARNLVIGVTLFVLLVALGAVRHSLEAGVAAQGNGNGKGNTVTVPRYEVDPTFPKPMPNGWYQGMTIGATVDAQDHIWVIHRPDSLSPSENAALMRTGACCAKAPPVLEFDQAGNLLRHWGGPGEGYDWPENNHGIMVDPKGNFWLGGNSNRDGQVLKFSADGKFLGSFGRKAAADSADVSKYGGVATMSFDPTTNEAFVADGYYNHRVAVADIDTMKIKRYWGAYGNKPDDADMGNYNPDAPPLQQFRLPVHCAAFAATEKLVYVCDRRNDRIQVFSTDGKFIKEKIIAQRTLGNGSVWEIAFSRDPQQKFMFVTDGANMKVWILDRASMEILSSFGTGGKQPGQFYAVHSIVLDSKSNIYTTETFDGRRLQRFLYKGMQTIEKGKDQLTVWPRSATSTN